MEQKLFTLDNFLLEGILEELQIKGATSVNLLKEDFRQMLLAEAQSYSYTAETEVVGTGSQIVRQQVSSYADFPPSTQYSRLKNAFQSLLEQQLDSFSTYPFTSQLNFNSTVLQKYELGSIGITPHRDRASYINLVCIFNISGQGKFCVCDDRAGTNAKVVNTSPGNVIFLKAPGFQNSSHRPFHYVTDIGSTRYTFGLRQKIK